MEFSDGHNDAALLLPIARLPEYPLMIVMTYLQGVYKPPSGQTYPASQGRNWRHRSKLVVPTSYDPDWYRPLGPVTGVNFTSEMFELLDRQMRWTSMSALRLTCKSFWTLSEKVVPLFSLLRQLRAGSIQLGAIPRPLTVSASLLPEEIQNTLKLVTPAELDLVLRSGVKSGVLKPQLFRSISEAQQQKPSPSSAAVREETSSNDLMPPLPSSDWYGTLSRQVHIAFEPLILPSAYDAPFTALQIASASQRHLSALRRSAGPSSEELGKLAAQTSVDYFIGEHRKRMEEDCETHIRFRLKVELKGDKEMDAPPRYLHFKSVVIQATSFVHERTEADANRDPLNLSPYFTRRSNAMPMRPPHGYVGLHSLAVETEDAVLAAELQLPPPGSGCSTIVTMIENGARGILEVHTRSDPHIFVPVVIIRTEFLNSLAKLRGMPGETAQELHESVEVISQWLSLVSMVDYSTPAAPQKLSDLERMYSYSFMDLETPSQGPLSPSYILNPHAFYLQPAIARFLGANVEEEYFSSSTELLTSTHIKPLSSNLTQFYHRSIESILEQFRWSHIVLPAIEFLAKQDLDFALHGPLSILCSRTKILDHSEVDLQRLPHTTSTPLDIISCTMYSTFEIRTTTPNISLRFTHRRYPMALSVSVVAPTTLEAWQWASKNRVLLNYFHYGCTPFYVPMPDLSHLSERYADVLSVSLLPTVPGAPQPYWTSDPLITNATLASTSVNCLEELEGRDSVCILRWDPSVTLEEWRKSANQSYGVPLDLHLVETLAAATGVPELSCDQFMTLLIRVFGQGFGRIPSEGDFTNTQSDLSPLETPMQHMPQGSSLSEDMPALTQVIEFSSIDTRLESTVSPPSAEMSTLSLEAEEESENQIATAEPTQNDVSPQYPSNFNRMNIYDHASVFKSKEITPPFGTAHYCWRPTVLVVDTPDTNWNCHSISMMPHYANLSNEQLRWADYNLLHPVDYGLSAPQAKPKDHTREIHPENVFVDPAVIGIYPDLTHKVYTENGIPFTLLMSSGERIASLQIVESRQKPKSDKTVDVDFLSSVNASKGLPKYLVADCKEVSSEPAQYCIVWRRTYADYVVSSHYDLLRAKSIFTSKFQSFTGQPWTLNCHTEGWAIMKGELSDPWKSRKPVFPPHYLQPTFLDPMIIYEFVSLKEGPNDFWSYLMPISSALRYWARFYRIVLADLPVSLEMIKLALLNDEPGMEDRVLSLMEYAEWCRACGDLKGTLEAVDAANVENAIHPLPWLAKADLSCLASLQCMDPKTEVQLIEQSVSLYSRFLTCAQRVTSQHARFNPNFRQASKDPQAVDLVPSGDEKGEQDASGEAVAVATSSESTPSGSLAAQTPSVTPLSIVSVLAYKNPLLYKAPMPPSLVHMRRAQWAVGKLWQRLDRHSEAKACYDELLRKYYKRERLELTLDRCAVLLALKKPKEAAETMEHALQKELVNNLTTTYAHSIYYRHVTALKARGFLLLAAALLANQSYEAAARALMTHRFYDPAEPRSAVVGSFLSLARSAPKQDLRTRMRIHGAHLFGFRNNPPNPAVGAPANPLPLAAQQPMAIVQAAAVGQQPIAAQPAANQALGPLQNPPPGLANPAILQNPPINLAQALPPQAAVPQVIRPIAAGGRPKRPHPANRALAAIPNHPQPANPLAQPAPPTYQTPSPLLNTNAVLSYLRSPDPFGYIAKDAARRHRSSNSSAASSSQAHTTAAAHSSATTPQTELQLVDESGPPTPSGLEPSTADSSSSMATQQWFSVKSPASNKRDKHEPSSPTASSSSSSMTAATPSSSSMAMDSSETAIKGIGSDSEEDIDNANSGEFAFKLPTSSDSPSPDDIVPSSTPSELAARRMEELNSPASSKLVSSSEDALRPQSSFSTFSDGKSLEEAEAVPKQVRNGATWKRFYGFVRYQNWELLTPLLEMMVDASLMKRRLLPTRHVRQERADEILLLPESTFLAALDILEHIRDLVDQGNLLKTANDDPDQQVKLEKLEKEISEAEAQYYEAMPYFRRLHVSFFVGLEIDYLRDLIDAAFACTILQRALQLKHAVESSTDPMSLHPVSNTIVPEGIPELTISPNSSHSILKTTNLPSSSSNLSQSPGIPQAMDKLIPSASESPLIENSALAPHQNDSKSSLVTSLDAAIPYPSLFSHHLLNRILNMTAPSFSAFSNPLVSTPFPLSVNQAAPETIENLFSSFPTKYVLDVLAEEVTLALLDRRTAKMQQILNAVGRPQSLRIISVTRKKPTQKPYVRARAPISSDARQNEIASHVQPVDSVSIPPIIQNASPPTLLWHFVPSFSLPRILMKGLELNRRKSIRSLTFSTALDKFELKMPFVAILVEVQLGTVFYCGPEQQEPPPGYDSLAIVNRFTTLQEDDGSISFLPQNNDSAVPVFKVFDQAQVGSVRYIIQGADSLPAAHLRTMAQ